MCGITGLIHFHRDVTEQVHIVEEMTCTLGKRGPDDKNVWHSNHVIFGQTRLVVVDPEGGTQPMSIETGGNRFTIIYNGELYNTEDLRQELLKRGYRFRGHSDTEVLLTAFIEWGATCLQKLNGIFAFAIWNEQKQELFLARDRLGVKPLFYTRKNNLFLFGSELKAILAHPQIEARVNKEGLAEIFGLGPARTPGHGVFEGIYELRPAHYLRYNREQIFITRYWNVVSSKHMDTLEETVNKIHWLLKDAVERQLVADVPVCTFLSGGVDSSAITAFAAQAFQKEGKVLHTYSIDYEDNDKYFTSSLYQPNSDGIYIEQISSAYATNHHALIINTEELVEYLKEAVRVKDLPGMADVDSSLLWFCRKIKEEHTVALSGECADEIFGGYPWFHRQELLEANNFPWMTSLVDRENLLLPYWQEKLQLQDYVQYRYEETIREVPYGPDDSVEERRLRELFYLNMHWFMATLLDRKDRMSMGASLEVRVPFADHRLVEYVWNIPWQMKKVGSREKGILRYALQGVLPEEILYRKKSPYPKTHHPAYTKAVKEWLSKIVTDPNSPILDLINKEKVREIIDTDGRSFERPWFGQLMKGPQLIAHLAQIDTWLREYNIKIV